MFSHPICSNKNLRARFWLKSYENHMNEFNDFVEVQRFHLTALTCAPTTVNHIARILSNSTIKATCELRRARMSKSFPNHKFRKDFKDRSSREPRQPKVFGSKLFKTIGARALPESYCRHCRRHRHRHCLWHRHRHRHRRCHRRRLRRLRHRAFAGRVCSARSGPACQRARCDLLSSFAG